MSTPRLTAPPSDPVGLFEVFNAGFGSKVLVAAARHVNLFDTLADRPQSFEALRGALRLAERPMQVLITALCALDLVTRKPDEQIELTPLAQTHLVSGSPFDVSDYLFLAEDATGVVNLVECLRTNRPAGTDGPEIGAQYIYREGLQSAMVNSTTARDLTLALAGRAMNTAPVLADRQPLDGAKLLLDLGGGTGIFSIAYLQRNPQLHAIVFDLPEVTRVTQEFAIRYGVQDRLHTTSGDMFQDPLPEGADVILLSNVLHDWDVDKCRQLLRRCAEALGSGGRVLIHDAFLNDDLDGPLHIALYSVILFYLTEGRAYSAAEYRRWLKESGFRSGDATATMVHCASLPATRI